MAESLWIKRDTASGQGGDSWGQKKSGGMTAYQRALMEAEAPQETAALPFEDFTDIYTAQESVAARASTLEALSGRQAEARNNTEAIVTEIESLTQRADKYGADGRYGTDPIITAAYDNVVKQISDLMPQYESAAMKTEGLTRQYNEHLKQYERELGAYGQLADLQPMAARGLRTQADDLLSRAEELRTEARLLRETLSGDAQHTSVFQAQAVEKEREAEALEAQAEDKKRRAADADTFYYSSLTLRPDYEKGSRAEDSKAGEGSVLGLYTEKGYLGGEGERGDRKYDFINDIGGAREKERTYQLTADPDAQKGAETAMGRLDDYGVYTPYTFMTEDEVGIYNYLYRTKGQKEAEKFLGTIEDTLSQRQAEKLHGEMTGLGKALFWVPQGLDQFNSGIRQLFSEDALTTSPVQYAGRQVRQDAADKSKLLGTLYDVGVTTANMAPSILVSYATSGLLSGAVGAGALTAETAGKIASAAGSASMGLSAGGNAYKQKLQEGWTQKQARTYGTLVGLSESCLQYLLGGIGKLSKGGQGLTDKALAGVLRQVGKLDEGIGRFALDYGARLASKGFSEGLEEGLQEILEPIIASEISGKDYYVDAGDVAYSFLLGALSVVPFEGGSTASEAVSVAQTPGYMGESGFDWFQNVKTPEELRERYAQLGYEHNLNNGGDPETLGEITRQHAIREAYFEGQNRSAGNTPEGFGQREQKDMADTFSEEVRRQIQGQTEDTSGPDGTEADTAEREEMPTLSEAIRRQIPGQTEETTENAAREGTAGENVSINENGLAAFSEREKTNFSSGSKNIIVSTFNDAVSFIKNALSNKQSLERGYLGKITDSTAQLVKLHTGIDIRGKTALINSDDIRHIIREHGDPVKEEKRGQIAVTPEDIAQIPTILASPDRVTASPKPDGKGRQTLLFEKEIGGNYVTVQAISEGKNSLQTDTLYIQKRSSQNTGHNAGDMSGPVNNARSEPLQSSSKVNNTIPQGGNFVNSGEQNGGTNYERTQETEPAEAAAGAGGIVSGRDGGRVYGERAGGQAGRLVGGTGKRRNVAGAEQSAKVNSRRRAAQDIRLEKIDVQSLGVSRAVKRAKNAVAPEEIWDDEMRAADELIYNETGKHITYVYGRMEVVGEDGKKHLVRGGFLKNGRIIVQCDNAKATVTQIAKHELFHAYADDNPGMRYAAKERVKEVYSEEAFAAVVNKYIAKLDGIISLSENPTEDEIEAAIDRVAEEVLADAYAGINAFDAHAEQFREEVEGVVDERRGYRGSQTEEATRDRTGPPERYSINEAFADDVQDWYNNNKPENEVFILGNTGAAMQGLGAIENDIYINGDKISEIITDHPEMTIKEIKRIPEIIEDPVLVLKSKGVNTSGKNARMVIFGSIKAPNGKPIMVVLDLKPVEDGICIDDMQKINSAYTRSHTANTVKTSEIMYADKKRTIPLLRSMGLQYRPTDLLRYGSLGSITYSGTDVNLQGVPFSSVIDETRMQKDKEYAAAVQSGDMKAAQKMVDEAAEKAMSDSKIRADDGRLLPVYHGTDADFTVFDRTKGRSTMDIQGSFFSPWEIDAGGYGGKVGKYYLNIKNPAPEGVAYQALNRFKGQNNAGVKAREYLESLGYDGVDNSGEEYIAFSPEQIKSAEPVTYDDNGNVIPLSERFNPKKKDIRFSADDEDAESGSDYEPQSVAEYIRGKAEGRFREEKTPKAPKTRAPAAESRPVIAKRDLKTGLLNLFSIPEGRRAEMGGLIDAFADKLYKQGRITQEDRDAFFDRLYSEGVMTVPAEDLYREGRRFIQEARIYVPQELKSEFGDDWNEFRRRAFAAGVYLVNNAEERGVDSWNMELAESYPGLFDAESLDERDMLERIVDMAEEGRDEKMSLSDYAASIAQAEGVTEDEMLDNMERQVDWMLRTFAEKAKLEVKLRDRTGTKITQERERMKEVNAKEREREELRRVRDRERRKESARRQRANREMRELQQRTLKQLQWLSRNRNKAPAELLDTWNEVLGDMDVYAVGAANEMNWSNKYQATWRDLANMYKAAREEDPNFLPSKDLEKIVARLDNDKIADLDVGALQDLYKAAVGLRTEFYNHNNVIGSAEHQLFSDVYDDVTKEMNEAKSGFTGRMLDKFINARQLTPMNFLERMSGWNRDSTWYGMARQLEKGERAARAYRVEAQSALADFLSENKDWVRRADGQGKDAVWYEIEAPELLEHRAGDKPIFSGKTVKVYMTPAQKVHMYLESKSYDNLRHMEGGRTFVNRDLYAKGKRQEAFAQGTTVKLAPESVKKIVSDLTPEEMELARALEPYYNELAKKRINEVSNALYGYDKAMSSYYAPIYTNRNYVKSEIGVNDVTAEGVGNLKARQYAKNPSYNISAFDAFERHIDQTARFVGMAIPAKNWQTMLNWQVKGNSMGDVITHKWGEESKKYIEDLLEVLQGGGDKGRGDFTSPLLSNYISAVFGANPGIVFKQAASFPQFASALGWENAPRPGQMLRVDDDLIRTYSKELDYRTLGYATPETAVLKNNPSLLDRNKVTRFLLRGGAIVAMDAGTVKRAWPWAENKVRREHPELEIGSEEDVREGRSPFYRKVAEEFEEAVSLTQPMYDEMHRPDIMKNSGGVMRAFTMFKTVPLQQYNSLRRAFGELNYAKSQLEQGGEEQQARAQQEYRAAAKKVGATVTATLTSVLMLEGIEFLNQLLKNGAKRYRDDDDDELTAQSVAGRVARNSVGDLAGMVIGGSELSDLISSVLLGEKWYGIEMPGGEQLNDVIDSFIDAAGTISDIVKGAADVVENDGDLGEYFHRHAGDYAKAAKEIAEKAAMYVKGLPVQNVEKYIMGAMEHISPELHAGMEDVFDTPAKNDLKDLSGPALEARLRHVMRVRGVELDDGTAGEMAGLYEGGQSGVIPADTPKSFTINSEERKLSPYQMQTYDLVWGQTVGDAIKELIESDGYRAADEETRAKMIAKLYEYGREKAKEVLFDDYSPDSWVANADELIAAGATPDEWTTPANRSSKEEKSKIVEQVLASDMTDSDKLAAVGRAIGTDMETESGKPTAWAMLNTAVDDDVPVDEAIRFMREDHLDEYMKWRGSDAKKAGVDAEDYIEFKEVCSTLTADKDANGESISGSKRDKVIAYIDQLDLTSKQKDALYYEAGYAESKIGDTPWHNETLSEAIMRQLTSK